MLPRFPSRDAGASSALIAIVLGISLGLATLAEASPHGGTPRHEHPGRPSEPKQDATGAQSSLDHSWRSFERDAGQFYEELSRSWASLSVELDRFWSETERKMLHLHGAAQESLADFDEIATKAIEEFSAWLEGASLKPQHRPPPKGEGAPVSI